MRLSILLLFVSLVASAAPLRVPLAAPLLAQGRAPARAQVTLSLAADVRGRPGGPVVALLSPGTKLSAGTEKDTETLVTFEGWVDASRLGAKRDSFPASVGGRLTLRLRAQPSPKGAIIAVLQPGTGLITVTREGTWMRVRRSAWISTAAIQKSLAASAGGGRNSTTPTQTAAPTKQARMPTLPAGPAGPARSAGRGAAPVAADSASKTGPKGRSTGVISSTGARFRDLPVGHVLGGIDGGSSVEIVARQFGWVRVRVDGWIPEKDLISGENFAPPSVTAADLRADPQGMKGRVVQWDVEVMSLQIADPLRIELGRDEPYLLARGPGEENAILYLAVPGTLLNEARALAPLAKVSITARVRSGRSEPSGSPILELLSIAKR